MDVSEMSEDGQSEWGSDDEYAEGYDSFEPDGSLDGDEPYGCEVVTARRRAPWDIITPTNIQQHQNDMLAEVSDVLACVPSHARVLLTEYRWDKAHLINDYVEKGQDYVFRRSGCPLQSTNVTPKERVILCGCCFCEVESEACTALECGHWFCNDCWRGHLGVQITDGNSCRLKCMGFKCSYACSDEMVLKLLQGGSALRDRYEHALLESYVNDNTNVKWCPSTPNCGNAVRSNYDECCEPICLCGLHFCFSCLSEAHSPCTCEMWTRWERKRMDDSETMNWITANTKPCPKCGKLVEKNGGCNLMTCRCGQHFCWLCGSATGYDHTYHTIANHECGRWKNDLDRSIGEAAASHKRYMHYFTRWNGHRDSLKKEQANEENILTFLKGLCDSLRERVYEYNSLIAAVRVLTRARKVLSNSYAFAFFLCGNNWYSDEVHPEQISLNQELFEDMQQQFEAEVERLSRFLSMTELPPEVNRETHLRDVLNCSRTTKKRMQNFFEAINSGLLGQLEQSVVSIADFMPYNLVI